MTIIIVLGESCSITYELERLQLKGPTSLFEWHASPFFNDVLDVIVTVIRGDNPVLSKSHENNWLLGGISIRTSHYNHTDYSAIINRRIKRFRDDVLSSDNILFVREQVIQPTVDEVERFYSIMSTYIPPDRFKLLILSMRDHTTVTHPCLVHEKFDELTNLQSLEKCFGPTLVKKARKAMEFE